MLENLADVGHHLSLLARQARGQQLAVTVDEATNECLIGLDAERFERLYGDLVVGQASDAHAD